MRSQNVLPSPASKFIDKIRGEQSKFEVDINRIRQGVESKPNKRVYRLLDESIQRLVDHYHHVDLVE